MESLLFEMVPWAQRSFEKKTVIWTCFNNFKNTEKMFLEHVVR